MDGDGTLPHWQSGCWRFYKSYNLFTRSPWKWWLNYLLCIFKCLYILYFPSWIFFNICFFLQLISCQGSPPDLWWMTDLEEVEARRENEPDRHHYIVTVTVTVTWGRRGRRCRPFHPWSDPRNAFAQLPTLRKRMIRNWDRMWSKLSSAGASLSKKMTLI